MSRTEIGDYLGLTIETVSRAIGKLKNRGVISLMASDEVVVLDNDKLRQIAKVERDGRTHHNDNQLSDRVASRERRRAEDCPMAGEQAASEPASGTPLTM